jgi:hypothetical protein
MQVTAVALAVLLLVNSWVPSVTVNNAKHPQIYK